MLEFEKQLWAQGIARIAGVDEAGRGPLAGPVVAACCILPKKFSLPVNDSKQLTEEERNRLFDQIQKTAGIEFGIGSASSIEIDRLNILRATFLAMSRALEQLSAPPDFVLIDGSLSPSFGIPTLPIVKGDGRSASIAAASILAKVTRDRQMVEWDALYPQYGFKVHKGYGTPEHLLALSKFGPCAIHRKSFEPIKDFFAAEEQLQFLSN